MENSTSTFGNSAADAAPADRASFIRKTYLLLAASILAFIVVEGFLFASGAAYTITNAIFGRGGIGWLPVLLIFMAVSWVLGQMAGSPHSTAMLYIGVVGFFVV